VRFGWTLGDERDVLDARDGSMDRQNSSDGEHTQVGVVVQGNAPGSNGAKPQESKLCAKFFSIHGCSYGDQCHFLHTYVHGLPVPSPPAPLPYTYATNGYGQMNEKMKTRLCRNFDSPEGCKFGDRCFFAHGEWELRTEEANIASGAESLRLSPPFEQAVLVPVPPAHVGTIVGKAGSNMAKVSSMSGAKVSMLSAEYTSADGDRLCRLVGAPLDVARAQNLIINRLRGAERRKQGDQVPIGKPTKSYKTKMCASWTASGSCNFGDNCHFAHGAEQLKSRRDEGRENVENVAVE
jgi:hypothetical protein